MKKNVLNVCLGLLCAFLIFSCSDDDDDIYVSYGVIQNVNSADDYEILTDKGNTLVVTKSYTNQTIENEKRVLVNYEVLSDKDQNKQVYEVRVNGFYNLLSKPMVSESFILQDEEARRDSIGDDPYNQIRAWIGGDFINIDFELLYATNSNTKHMINLVYNDVQAHADTIYVRLYHNAYGEVPGKGLYLYSGIGRSSFKITDIIPENVSTMPIKLTWLEYESYDYNPRERSGVMVFEREASSTERTSGLLDFRNDSAMEVK